MHKKCVWLRLEWNINMYKLKNQNLLYKIYKTNRNSPSYVRQQPGYPAQIWPHQWPPRCGFSHYLPTPDETQLLPVLPTRRSWPQVQAHNLQTSPKFPAECQLMQDPWLLSDLWWNVMLLSSRFWECNPRWPGYRLAGVIPHNHKPSPPWCY